MDFTIILDNIMWFAMITGIVGLWYNSTPDYRGKMISYEVWIVSNIFWMIGGLYTNNIPLVIFEIACIVVSIRGIYTHMVLADIEKSFNEELLEIPPK